MQDRLLIINCQPVLVALNLLSLFNSQLFHSSANASLIPFQSIESEPLQARFHPAEEIL
jgi:hypothetical protein